MRSRKQTIPLHSAPCRSCGAWGLVLESGAKRPWLYCAQCGRTTQAPDRESWRPGTPAEQKESGEEVPSVCPGSDCASDP